MKQFLPGLVLIFVIVSAPALLAQDDGSDTAPAGNAAGAGDNGQRMEKWKQVMGQLNLTDSQKQQMQQIRAHTQPGKERRQQIMAVLSPDQKQKLMTMLKEYRSGQAGQ